MPETNEAAKTRQLAVAAAIGHAIRTRRILTSLSASALAERTAELGYPITRGTIAKIESNSRSGKMDVLELLTLARSLDLVRFNIPDGDEPLSDLLTSLITALVKL